MLRELKEAMDKKLKEPGEICVNKDKQYKKWKSGTKKYNTWNEKFTGLFQKQV